MPYIGSSVPTSGHAALSMNAPDAEEYHVACAAAAQLYDVELEPGDVVVFGSDGLFDNVWDHDIAAVVMASIAVRTPTRLAQVLSCGDFPCSRHCCERSARERL